MGGELGVGRALVEAIIDTAKKLGYREVRLDTLPTMGPAQDIYLGSGFEEIEPYYDSPIANTLFLRLDISSSKKLAEKFCSTLPRTSSKQFTFL